MQNLVGKDTDLLDFMRSHGFPVFHLSNIFYRDFQYGVRDYYRANEGIDVGTLKADEIATLVIQDMEKRNILTPHSKNTWILNNERYLLPRQKPEKKPEAATEKAS